jgi:hypothetical protein
MSIAGEVEFEGQNDPLELGPWDWILDDHAYTAYVQADLADPDPLRSDLLADAVGQVLAAVFRIERGDEFARLLACKAKDRVKILRRLVGEEELPELAEIERAYLEATEDEKHEFEVPSAAFAPLASGASLGPQSPPSPPTEPLAEDITNQPLKIEPREHVSPPASPGIQCRVTRRWRENGMSSLGGGRRVTDWRFCEYKVMEIEENDSPPRFPVLVSNVTGWKAPGVDVLTFASAEDRARFLPTEKKDDTLVARFIEVKGRSAEGAKIDLRGNELAAAQRHRSRYFLYRVFDRGDGSYKVTILKDPLGDAKGTRAVVEVNLEAAEGTQEFSITGGITESTYLAQESRPPAESVEPAAT